MKIQLLRRVFVARLPKACEASADEVQELLLELVGADRVRRLPPKTPQGREHVAVLFKQDYRSSRELRDELAKALDELVPQRFFVQDEAGQWLCKERARQCVTRHTGLFGPRCQGSYGHAGNHWAFGPDGWLHWLALDITDTKIAGGMTPPDHPHYKSPSQFAAESARWMYATYDVVDPELLAQLEQNQGLPEGHTFSRGQLRKRREETDA